MVPPGAAERVLARSALVVAPHYDDEVLGCGGLVAQLVAAGAEVRVLFLSDGSGGSEAVDDRAAYARRRRGEAKAALALLGVAGAEHLGLPDGQLAAHRQEIVRTLRHTLLERLPELLLVPGPGEVSGDHRAAFLALFELLHPLRAGDELAPVAERLRILLYEVNHPAHPDLLVDVSAEVATIEAAMACYASQQERHDYLGAALGLRRFRALPLPAGIVAAEGYRRLRLADFTTRGAAALAALVGARLDLAEVREGPAISVVVRTHRRPELLAEALASIAASTYRRLEVVLVNDGGEPPEVPADYPLPVVRRDLPQREGRAGAANAGIAAASGPYLAFLDDDDLVEREHYATLAAAVAAPGVEIAYSDAAVGVYELGPRGWEEVERRLPYSRDFDPDLLLVDNYIPFHTLLAPLERVRAAGPLDPELPFFEDWELLVRLAALAPFHHLRRVTCEYRHFRGGGHALGERPRERGDFLAMKERVVARHRDRLGPGALARLVDRLRTEAVEQGEAAAASRREAEEARRRAAEAEDRAHRLFGEVEALRALDGDRRRLAEERPLLEAQIAERDRDLQRLYEAEAQLRAKVGEQEEHLARVYAEIERLGGVIEEMRATRAWRAHEWWQQQRTRR